MFASLSAQLADPAVGPHQQKGALVWHPESWMDATESCTPTAADSLNML